VESIKDKRNTHKVLVGTPEEKEKLGRNGNRQEGQTGSLFYL
jgi:hypothetical protein